MLDIQDRILEQLNETKEKAAEINRKFLALDEVSNEQFDLELGRIESEIAAVKSKEEQLLNIDITCKFKLPTQEELENAKLCQISKVERAIKYVKIGGIKAIFASITLNSQLAKDQQLQNTLDEFTKEINNNADINTESIKSAVDTILKKYWNLQLRSTLFKLKADLLDAFSQKNTDAVSNEEKIKAITDSQSAEVKCIYEALQRANLNKIELVNYLYDFEKAEDRKQSYFEFKEKFITRLNSYDFEMREQDKNWSERKLTIITAILTLGLALGISYAVTKVTTGKAYLFWEKTHKQAAADKLIEYLSSETLLANSSLYTS